MLQAESAMLRAPPPIDMDDMLQAESAMFRAPPRMKMMCAAAPPMADLGIVKSAQYARRCSVSDDSGRADSSD